MAAARKAQAAAALEAWRALGAAPATAADGRDDPGLGGHGLHGAGGRAATATMTTAKEVRQDDDGEGEGLDPRAAALVVLGAAAVRAKARPLGFLGHQEDLAATKKRARVHGANGDAGDGIQDGYDDGLASGANPRACKGCWTLLVPGETCCVRTEPQRRPQKTRGTAKARTFLVATCRSCGARTVLARGPSRKEKRWLREEAADPTVRKRRFKKRRRDERTRYFQRDDAGEAGAAHKSSSQVRVAAAKALGVLAATQAAMSHASGSGTLLDRLAREKQRRSITSALAPASEAQPDSAKPPSTLQSFFAALNRGK